jgi:glycine cleavage system regulatory protein
LPLSALTRRVVASSRCQAIDSATRTRSKSSLASLALAPGADSRQNRRQELPGASDRFDLDTLAGRVRAADGRPEGNHVQARVASGDETALETGVDHLDRRFGAEFRR